MAKKRKLKVSVLVGSAVVLLSYVASALLVGDSSSYTSDVYVHNTKAITAGESITRLDLRVNAIQAEQQLMDVSVQPALYGEYGQTLGSGSYVLQPMQFNFDSYSEQNSWDANAGEYLGGINLQVRLTGDVRNYPFDSYSGSLFAQVATNHSYNDKPVTSRMFDTLSPVEGWSLRSSALPIDGSKPTSDYVARSESSGLGQISWSVARSNSSIVVACIFGILMLSGAVMSTLMTLAILRGKRPPSVHVLGWLAAFLFALFSVRSHMPGNPPSGVYFDLAVFYPVALVHVLLIAVTAIAWISRDDWDMENELHATHGKFAANRDADED